MGCGVVRGGVCGWAGWEGTGIVGGHQPIAVDGKGLRAAHATPHGQGQDCWNESCRFVVPAACPARLCACLLVILHAAGCTQGICLPPTKLATELLAAHAMHAARLCMFVMCLLAPRVWCLPRGGICLLRCVMLPRSKAPPGTKAQAAPPSLRPPPTPADPRAALWRGEDCAADPARLRRVPGQQREVPPVGCRRGVHPQPQLHARARLHPRALQAVVQGVPRVCSRRCAVPEGERAAAAAPPNRRRRRRRQRRRRAGCLMPAAACCLSVRVLPACAGDLAGLALFM